MREFFVEAIVYILIFVVLALGLAGMNKCTNDLREDRCIEKGGQYYRAGMPEFSLCKLPTK